MRHLDYPPVWLFASLLLAWLQARFVPLLSFGLAADLLGWILVLAGLGLMGAAAIEFGRSRTTIIPGEEPAAMITGGVYRFSRNPIYLGDTLLLLGVSLIWDSLLGLLLAPAFAMVIERRFIRPEEEMLRRAFGPAFDAYRTSVRRWI